MEPNNFEKKIQQKMDELKISPSDLVWTNIEKRIGKKHTDRKVIFIFFFLFFFLLSGGYWLFNSMKHDSKIQPVSRIIKSNSQPTDKRDSSLDKAVMSSSNLRKHDTVSVAGRKPKTSVVLPSTILHNKSGDNRIDRKQKKLVGKTAFKSKGKTENFSEGTNNKQPKNEENKIVLNNPYVSETERKNKIADSANDHQNKIYSDSLSDELKPEKVTAAIVAKNDSARTRYSVNKHRKHWLFGVTFSGGRSLLGNGLLDIDKENNYYSVSDPNMNQGNPIPGSGGSNGSYALPSAINNSVAFIGGAFIEKDISAESKISLGISYKYFSLVNKVGSRSGTALDQYNAINTVHDHRNNFHYLELPVSVKFQLNDSKALPLYWQAGINISQLISSNALQFQSSPGLYYKDNSLFNKTQFGLITAISATLFSKQKVPLTIGPYFYYSVSRLADKGLYGKKHFNFIGIRTELLFPKK